MLVSLDNGTIFKKAFTDKVIDKLRNELKNQ